MKPHALAWIGSAIALVGCLAVSVVDLDHDPLGEAAPLWRASLDPQPLIDVGR